MSDTPQNDEVINEEVNTEVEINDSALESETSNQVQDESPVQVDKVELAKQKTNEAFNKQYGQLKQVERERDALQAKQDERERERQQAKQDEFDKAERERQQALISNIPDMPDAFDDDYDVKVKKRDEAIVAQADYNARNQAYLQQQQYSQQQEAQAKQLKQTELVSTYSKRATELGISTEELQAAGNVVGGYGLSEGLVNHILADKDGALITKHLAANPQEGYDLASMSPYQVGSFLDGIKSKASALKPKTSNAPSPVDNLNGVTSDFEAKQYKHIAGSEIDIGDSW